MKKTDLGTIMRSFCRIFRPATYFFILVLQVKDFLQGQPMDKLLNQRIDTFCSLAQKGNRSYVRRLKRDMLYCYILYKCTFEEYFIFAFHNLSDAARREYILENEQLAICRKLTTELSRKTFWDKWETYKVFKNFYHRDVIKVDSTTSFNDFSCFIKKHSKFIVKRHESSCGRGIYIADTSNMSNTESFFLQLQQENVVLEELIVQSQAFKALHPESVNTIRCATFLKDGKAHILFTFLRVGQGQSVIDNGGAGGLIAFIDTDSGIVVTPGMTETRKKHYTHPDTGVQLIGMQIPQWEELKKFALDLAVFFPEQPYVSWDLALTDIGWVMVEGNHAGEFVGPQLTTGQGIRPFLAPYFDL